ncbi:efflux RND transporter periplasmic adaptor subunit [Candidatus Gracilibacteria bacterium]|nr:efflux RND transporter periplasmic adaptor subunit [Candidatus Gracilibacteria bacterium]MCF7896973.1 efflux RND transporter periplasmic adaptor subunit [Candidatus Gracilibacteria bacterium]
MSYKTIIRKYRKAISAGGIIFVILIVLGCTASNLATETESSEKVYVPKVKTALVVAGLSREISTTGEVQAAKSATLTAETRSDVKNVLVKVGDEVRAGQTLIQLSSDSVVSTRSTAGAAFVNAQNSLTQTQISSEQSIESAQVALETAEINLANTLAQNSALKKQAEEALNSSKLSSGLSSASAQTTLDNAIRSAFPTAQNAVSECDQILGVSATYKNSNDDFEHFLGALKSASKPLAESAISTALNALNAPAEDYSATLVLLRAAEDATAKTLDVLNYSTTGTTFTQATLNSDISTINTQLSAVRTAISTLRSAQAALESAQQNSNGTSQTILSAEANYNATLSQLSANEKSVRQSVESARAALESAQKSAELTRTSARASLDAVAGTLSQAQISQSKLTIRAPFFGKITSIEVEPGDQITAGGTLIRLEDSAQLKIVAQLSATEVRKISVGDEVKIAKSSLDKISSISPSADPITKKYAVEIYHKNPYLQPGEFVKLRFQIGEANAVDSRIFLPINAINILGYGSFVWKIQDGKAVKQEVQLGEIEGEFVEILSGLNLEEEVVVEGGRILDIGQDELAVEIAGG